MKRWEAWQPCGKRRRFDKQKLEVAGGKLSCLRLISFLDRLLLIIRAADAGGFIGAAFSGPLGGGDLGRRGPLRIPAAHLKGRRFWIMSEPQGPGWKAFIVEMMADQHQEEIGIEATAETRTAADDAAERKLRRMLQAY